MKETRASGVHYLPHFIRHFYKVCCLPFQIHDRNKYKAWKERASQSCLLPSPLPPSPFPPVSQDTFVSSQLHGVLFLPKTLVLPPSWIVYSKELFIFFFFPWEDISNTPGFWRRPAWSCSEIFYFHFFSIFFSNWQRLEGLTCNRGCIRKTYVKCPWGDSHLSVLIPGGHFNGMGVIWNVNASQSCCWGNKLWKFLSILECLGVFKRVGPKCLSNSCENKRSAKLLSSETLLECSVNTRALSPGT